MTDQNRRHRQRIRKQNGNQQPSSTKIRATRSELHRKKRRDYRQSIRSEMAVKIQTAFWQLGLIYAMFECMALRLEVHELFVLAPGRKRRSIQYNVIRG